MSAATVLYWRAGAALLMAAALGFGAPVGRAQETKEAKKESEKKTPEKTEPEIREFRLTVVVVAGEAPSPVNRANVILFYGDDSREAPTGTDGRVTFRFTTAAKTATVRVRADKLNPYQTTISLNTGEVEHRALLTKSN